MISVALLLALELVVFDEPGFPALDVAPAIVSGDVPGAVVAEDVDALRAALVPGNALVWRHGSAFPAEAWSDLVRFLEGGGSLVVLGGEPFTRPVVGEPGERVVQPRTVSLLKELRLNQCARVAVGGAEVAWEDGALPARTLGEDAWIAVLEPRFSDTRDFEHEDGAPGARDAILRPLALARRPADDPRFPAAAASYVVDRLRGRFAGGRWAFWLASEAPTAAEVERLLDEVARPPLDLRADPTFGCFHAGERPSVTVRVHRPGAAERYGVGPLAVALTVVDPTGREVLAREVALRAGVHASELVPLDVGPEAGLYRVRVAAEGAPTFETGFWIFDAELFASGDELAMGEWSLLRNGRPEPVIGTTVMSRSVQRKFLFEPNAAEWDDTFAELASIDVNLVRTGVWSGWRKLSLDPNVVDEGFLRALEAYYLTARKHGLPVLFTFFAFVPEAFGGASPYFDPRSLEGQRALLSAVAGRFRGTREMFWDLINEPSFANPDKLWRGRPNGDRFELEAFRTWLAERYGGGADGRTWEDVVRARWRLLPDEPIGLPTEDDFAERAVFERNRPYRAKEWAHFAQDAFTGWVREMTAAIREAGSTAPITVGQDEGGLFERPSPLFHADAVDFTSIHTWWFDDELQWDGALAKAPRKPMLVSETGVMQRELLSGEALRTPEVAAKLLSRKVGHAFGAGAFGLVQWCYDVNPYMASDNEVAIGLRRVDGSYEPEHAVLRDFASFFARNRGRFQGYAEPEIALVLPSGDHWSPRGMQELATQNALRALGRVTPEVVQVVPEHRTRTMLGERGLVVLPACRGISDGAWADLAAAVERGAVLQLSGWFERDDAGLPARRLGVEARPLMPCEPLAFEEVLLDQPSLEADQSWPLALFERGVFQSAFAAAPDPSWSRSVATAHVPYGPGRLVHCPVPVEWSANADAVLFVPYAMAVSAATLALQWEDRAWPRGVVVRRLPFAGCELLSVVNERSRPVAIEELPLRRRVDPLALGADALHVPAGEARLFVMEGGRVVDRSGR